MAVENVFDATPWGLTNTPLGGGGYREGHVIQIASRSLAFKPLCEHSSLFDSYIIILVITLEDGA